MHMSVFLFVAVLPLQVSRETPSEETQSGIFALKRLYLEDNRLI